MVRANSADVFFWREPGALLPSISPFELIRYSWLAFLLVWLFFALRRKKTKKRENLLKRLGYVLPLVFAWFLLESPRFEHTPLATRFVRDTVTVAWIGAAITASGVLVAFWARWHLGTNWSGVVTLKEGHELVRSGPYRNIRHPIYTGILVALLGTAIAHGEIRGLLALAVTWISFYVKARREEQFLREEFGPRFEEHSRQTGMFLPRFSWLSEPRL